MNSSIILEGKGIEKVYGKGESAFHALRGVDISLSKGESLAIVGKSGSGKSTLMHLLALMDSPTKGTLAINGHEVNSLGRKELDKLRNETFGFVFQQFFLNGRSSVLDNVILPLKIAGVGVRERQARGLAALEAVELSDKAKNKANDLSGGQKQRVCIARALVNDPTLILADEFTGNLDSATGEKVEELVFSLQKERGVTLIIVTHDPELAAKCERQIHIKDGLVVEEEHS